VQTCTPNCDMVGEGLNSDWSVTPMAGPQRYVTLGSPKAWSGMAGRALHSARFRITAHVQDIACGGTSPQPKGAHPTLGMLGALTCQPSYPCPTLS